MLYTRINRFKFRKGGFGFRGQGGGRYIIIRGSNTAQKVADRTAHNIGSMPVFVKLFDYKFHLGRKNHALALLSFSFGTIL